MIILGTIEAQTAHRTAGRGATMAQGEFTSVDTLSGAEALRDSRIRYSICTRAAWVPTAARPQLFGRPPGFVLPAAYPHR